MAGEPDEQVLRRAAAERRIVVTDDQGIVRQLLDCTEAEREARGQGARSAWPLSGHKRRATQPPGLAAGRMRSVVVERCLRTSANSSSAGAWPAPACCCCARGTPPSGSASRVLRPSGGRGVRGAAIIRRRERPHRSRPPARGTLGNGRDSGGTDEAPGPRAGNARRDATVPSPPHDPPPPPRRPLNLAVAHDRWRSAVSRRFPPRSRIDVLAETVARLRAENGLLRARLRRMDPRRRPRYAPVKRLRILWHQARHTSNPQSRGEPRLASPLCRSSSWNSSTVRPASRMSARSRPLPSVRWSGTVSLRCGGAACRIWMWLPFCRSTV